MCMYLCAYVDELTFTRAAASECLVWSEHPEVLLEGDELSGVREREGWDLSWPC